MNALVKKEIRLLLPSWIVALSLAVVPMWLVNNLDNFGGWGFFVLLAWLGMIALSLESFGREFSPGVFCFFMSQPEERKHLWRAKVTTLAAAIGSVLIAFYASWNLRQLEPLHLTQNGSVVDDAMLVNLQTAPALALTAFAGGLWSTLLLRQTVAAMWFVILPPIAIAISVTLLLPENPSLHTYDSLLINVALIIYSVASYLFARWLFFRAQEVGWTGGTISFSTWKYFDASEKSAVKRKKRGAVAALFAKELQLHSISLFCAAALLVLHIIAIWLRPHLTHKHPVGELASNGFFLLWLMMPVIIGGMAVAEERKLGVMEGLLCLPASRRLQFAIKFFMALFFGTLLGGVMPLVLEKIATILGAPNGTFDGRNGDGSLQNYWFMAAVVIATMMLTFVAFFASTLSKNFLHAVGVAVATALSCGLFFAFIVFVAEHNTTFFGITLWHSVLPIIIAIPVIVATLFRLAWLNFKTIHEDRRMWWRNIFRISGSLIFIIVSSTVIYNRAWEIFEAAEPSSPPRGAAKFSLSDPPKFQNSNYGSLLVRLPDGRAWFSYLEYPFSYEPNHWIGLWKSLTHPLPEIRGPNQFIAGSNWISVSAQHTSSYDGEKFTDGYLDTAGVKDDGTLWISSEARTKIWTGAKMVRLGDETNWQQIARSYGGMFGNFLILKTDGTLWHWGTTSNDWDVYWKTFRTNWPSVRTFKLQQIGTDSDWKEVWHGYARKTDGTAWRSYDNLKDGWDKLQRDTNYDRIVSLNWLQMNDNLMACVATNGTLWACNRYWVDYKGWEGTGLFFQIGTETNWVAVAGNWDVMTALKSDGSLWRLKLPRQPMNEIPKIQPVRLGIHNDWVGLVDAWGGTATLAADGSLWLWPVQEYYDYDDYYGMAGISLLRFPKQPEFLGNVFGKPD